MRTALGALIGGLLLAASALAQVPYAPVAAPQPGPSVCPGGLCQPEALETFFEALAATEEGRRYRAVHVLQLGDSHTAGDRITGKLRADLQRRFGDGGLGVLPAGVPYAGYAPMRVRVEAQEWDAPAAPLATGAGYGLADVGLAGVQPAVYGRAPMLRFTPDPGAEPGSVTICFRAGGRSSDFHLISDGRWLPVATPAPSRTGPVCVGRNLLTGPGGAVGPIELWAHGAGVLAYSIRLEGTRPGVALSNLGVVGATLADLAARDEAVAAVELAAWRPSLIVLAFGTNEGFDDALDPVAYEGLLRGQIARMRRLAPEASLMILGAPDALRSGAASGCSADRLRAPPPSLALVRDVQRRVAADMGVAFWDWHGRMGGDCSADRLALRAEPLMRGDRVHFTGAGADWIGGVLAGDLIGAYQAWKARASASAGAGE